MELIRQDPADLCRLCRLRPTDEDSHILPKFVGRKAKKAGKNRLIPLTGPEQFVQDTTKLPFLCTVCEDEFGRALETPFARIWFHRYPNFAQDQKPSERAVRFYNSVAWRVLRYLMDKGALPEQAMVDARATESSLRDHLHNGGPPPSLNAYLFYASDFDGIEGAAPQELLEVAAGFSIVVFTVLPLRSAIVSLIGPFVHVLEMQSRGTVLDASAEGWEDFRLIAGTSRSPSHPPPATVTRYLKRILCTQRGEHVDDVMPAP